MSFIGALWLPILLSGVFVFVLSSIIHMMLSYHKSDVSGLPNEEAARSALGPLNIPPGDYMMPYCKGSKEMKSAEYTEKLNQGPVAFMTVMPNGSFKMGASLVQWFIYILVVAIFSGYVTDRALGPGASYLDVFRFVGTTAFMGLGLGLFQNSIWYMRKWSATLKSVFDALIYALVMAGTFGWLWPSM